MTTPNINPSRRRKSDDADEFTNEVQPPAATAVATKKLSLAIDAPTHTAEKIGAATRGNTMLAEVIELLRARNGMAPWPADVVASVKAQIAATEEPATSAAKTTRSRRTRASS